MTWIVLGLAFFYVIFGGDGLSGLSRGATLGDPVAWCMLLFGVSAVVMLAAGIRTRSRFRRNGAAVLSDAEHVVISGDRVRSGLFSLALALAVPQLVFRGLATMHWYTIGMAFALAYFAVQALRRALQPTTLAVLDLEGITAPQIWLGTIRWDSLDDIRVGQTAPLPRSAMRLDCLALVFREGLSAPQRVAPSRSFDEHLGLGIFMLAPSWLGLNMDDAISGLNGWLERSRA
jgi:hypothetical protein